MVLQNIRYQNRACPTGSTPESANIAASLKGGRYEVRGILGQGGMGVVYKCDDTVVRREVALKTIRDAPGKAALEMFYIRLHAELSLQSLHQPRAVCADAEFILPYFQ